MPYAANALLNTPFGTHLLISRCEIAVFKPAKNGRRAKVREIVTLFGRALRYLAWSGPIPLEWLVKLPSTLMIGVGLLW